MSAEPSVGQPASRPPACEWCRRAYPTGRGSVRRVLCQPMHNGPTRPVTWLSRDVRLCPRCACRYDRNPNRFGALHRALRSPRVLLLLTGVSLVLLLVVVNLMRGTLPGPW